MAIKISGSTIIDDNRHIVNAGVVTATSFDGSGADLDSIPNGALDNSSVSYGGVSLSLGGSDATPAFDLTDATSYPYASLTGISTEIVGDTSPQLGGNLDVNAKNINFGDSSGAQDDRLNFGASTDLSIFHNGTNGNSVISALQDGRLNINAQTHTFKDQTGSLTKAIFNVDGSKEFPGISTFGATAAGLTTSIHVPDSVVIGIGSYVGVGSAPAMEVYSAVGTASVVRGNRTAAMLIVDQWQRMMFYLKKPTAGAGALMMDMSTYLAGDKVNDCTVLLNYYDDSASTNGVKLQTEDYGVKVIGLCSATSFQGDGSALTGIVASGSGVSIKNSGTLVGTASTLNFGDNLDVSALSGGAVTITGSAGGGSSSGGSEIDITSCLFI